MKRVLLLGSGGSGKTTFARKLAQKTGLPLYHLDSLYWKPNWTKPDDEAWREQVGALAARDAWIIDGSYMGTLTKRVPRADLIIFLDLPNYVCLWNILKRRIRFAAFTGRTRPGMPPQCPEKIYFSFVKWVWRYPEKDRPKVFDVIRKHKSAETKLLVFNNYRQLQHFLETVPDEITTL